MADKQLLALNTRWNILLLIKSSAVCSASFHGVQRLFRWHDSIRASNSFSSCGRRWIWRAETTSPKAVDTPQKLSSANNFLVNQWWASLPGVRQPPPPPPPLLLRTRKWDGLHYVYCCSSWWAPILGTWLVIRAQLNIIIFHVLAEQEMRLWWGNNISTSLRWPLPSDPYNKYTRSHCSLRPF